ncbi:MAG: hydantoinase B/oxoprolinase family protein [Planctomycetes bacterium]|nr:hydantoinase B/oxoprolinase family protein [Planctomycetota bacterium]
MPEVDLITREVIQNALASAADEMALALYRTAYSTIVRDCLDFSTSVCNAGGDMIAQGSGRTVPREPVGRRAPCHHAVAVVACPWGEIPG